MTDLAIAVTVDRPHCAVKRLGSPATIVATLSEAMAGRQMWIRPGDLVRVDFDLSPPEIVYRWRRARVVAVHDTSVTIATEPSDDDLSVSASAALLEALAVEPAVGDVVFVDVRYRRPFVIDVANENEPLHPERFGKSYAHTRDQIRSMVVAPLATPESTRMHADELDVDVTLVRRLLRAQRPHWADLPLVRVPSSGTDNAMFRLGDDMVVRIPRIGWAVHAVEHEHRWLPELAPHLPLQVPQPLWLGEPGEGYRWPWSIYRWLVGDDAFTAPIADLRQAAKDVATFIDALQAIDSTAGPRATEGGGAPLATADESMRWSIAAAEGLVDTDAVTATWEAALRAPLWDHPPVWIHRDIASSNLLVRRGRIFAVIDWSGLAVGDPARDLAVAWEMFDADSREVFRAELNVDDATWIRARGWALTAITGLSYYRHTNPDLVTRCGRAITAVLAEVTGEP